MTEAQALIESIAARWRDDDLRLSLDGRLARLEIDGTVLERPWIRMDAGRSSSFHLPHDSELEEVVVLGERITPSAAERIRKQGGWYIDAAGNGFVRASGIHLDVRGRKPLAAADRTPRRSGRETNLMSARRSQVIFCLLNWPELVGLPMRTISRVSGTSLSLAHSTIALLVEDGFLASPGSHHLGRRDELLDQWAASFPLGLGRSLELGRFVGEPDVHAFAADCVDFRVSGEVVAAGIEGPDLTLYVPELRPQQIARSRWRRPDHEASANIVVRRKFWTDPWPPDPRRGHAAPELLVYADLLASREPRQREAALSMRAAIP